MRTPITSVDDLRARAKRRVPRAIFDYADGGSYGEVTLRANRDDLRRIALRQRVMVDVSDRSGARPRHSFPRASRAPREASRCRS